MTDLEKVIKGLECCLGSNECDVEPKEDCPYKGMCLCAMALRFDVLALLKDRDPLAVDEGKVNKCVCGNEINRYWHPEYCGFCGKKLEWY